MVNAYDKNIQNTIIPMETTVIDIEWSPDIDGDLVPIILITPIFFNGWWIGKIPGFNVHFIRTRGIGPGAVLKIGKTSSDLPYIMEVIKIAPSPITKKIDNLKVY
jgi:hypothetical protein